MNIQITINQEVIRLKYSNSYGDWGLLRITADLKLVGYVTDRSFPIGGELLSGYRKIEADYNYLVIYYPGNFLWQVFGIVVFLPNLILYISPILKLTIWL